MVTSDGIEVAESIEDSAVGSSGNVNLTGSEWDLQQKPKKLLESSYNGRRKPDNIASDTNQNPETPTGFMCLKLRNTNMKSWNMFMFWSNCN